MAEAADRHRDRAHGNIYSVLGGTEIEVLCETHFARPWPDRKPVYE